jgi:hypothetical protein
MKYYHRLPLMALWLLCVSCVGCGSSSGGALPGKVISRSREVYIASIADAPNTTDDTHVGSGAAASAEFRAALATRGITISNYSSSNGYTLEARFTHWEDHATQWTGVPDVIEFSVELRDNHDGQPAAVVQTKAVGPTIEFSNPSPATLIPKAVRETLDRIYK